MTYNLLVRRLLFRGQARGWTRAWRWSVHRGLFALGGTTCNLVWRVLPDRHCSEKVRTLDRNDSPDTDAFSALFCGGARKKDLESVSGNGMYSPTETSPASSPLAETDQEKSNTAWHPTLKCILKLR